MDSIDYYDRYASAYYENTVNLSMEKTLDRFLKYIPEDSDVLDLGCGSGRDSLYMEEAGVFVTPMDGSVEICKLAEIYIDKEVLCLRFDEMEFDEVFDGIWACSSLTHVEGREMHGIMERVMQALKPSGILYASFPYGKFEGFRNGRFFHEYTEATLKKMMEGLPYTEIIDLWKSDDVGGKDRVWLNILVQK